jgi:hypothetical protein
VKSRGKKKRAIEGEENGGVNATVKWRGNKKQAIGGWRELHLANTEGAGWRDESCGRNALKAWEGRARNSCKHTFPATVFSR